MDRFNELNKLTTFDLAFSLATGKLKTEEEKLMVLDIIKSRDANNTTAPPVKTKSVKPKKAPIKGSKAEVIQKLIDSKHSAKDIFDYMNNPKKHPIKGMPSQLKWKKTYYPEIYRLINNQ